MDYCSLLSPPLSLFQDMLVVVYLANLTRTQLALSEKLQSLSIAAA